MSNLSENVNVDEIPMGVTQSISLKEKLAYGIGDFGCNMVYATVSAFLLFFYTDIVGMSAITVGAVVLYARAFDAFDDIIMGMIVDRTKSKHGKARPWILFSAVPLGVCLIFLFSKPNYGDLGNAIYLFIFLVLTLDIFYSTYFVSHSTLVALITQNQNDRAVLNITRMIMGTSAALIITTVTMPLIKSFGGGAQGWQYASIIFGVIASVTILISFFFTKERVKPKTETKENVPFLKGIAALLHNKYWIMIFFVGILQYSIMTFQSINIYYVTYILGNSSLMAPLMMAYFLATIAGMILLMPLIKKIGKRNSVYFGFVIFTIGTLIIIINPYNLIYIMIGTVLKGLGFAPLVSSFPSFIADTVEYGEWKTGLRIEGLIFAAESFGTKFGNGLTIALLGWLLTMSGYVGGSKIQTELATDTIIALFTYVPLVIFLLVIIILKFYKLDKEYINIVKELKSK